MILLDVQNLHKKYGDKVVLTNVSFSIQKGDMFAILGVNGAGKTTLLECIEGLRSFHQGTITFADNIGFGVQLQSSTLPAQIKVAEIIQLLCRWNPASNYDRLLSIFDLHKIQNQTYQSLSTGQQRKLHLVLALVQDADLLFLDEPTAGLDVEARAEFHAYLKKLNHEGKTIVFSSHDMSELESLCQKMIFLQNGQVYFNGTIQEFKQKIVKHYTVHIKTTGNDETEIHELSDLTTELYELFHQYKQQDITIEDIQIVQPTLEDVFMQIVKENSK